MLKKLKNHLTAIAAVLVIAAPGLVPAVASAAVTPTDLQNNLCSGTNIDVSGNTTDCNAAGSTDGVNTFLTKAVTIFSAVVGVIAVIMIIYGGLRYITSGGDSNRVSSAKNTLIYAIIGLIIVALAQIIVRYVLNQASSISS